MEKSESDGVKHGLIVNRGLIGNTPEQTRDANLKAPVATLQFSEQTIGKASSTNRQPAAIVEGENLG